MLPPTADVLLTSASLFNRVVILLTSWRWNYTKLVLSCGSDRNVWTNPQWFLFESLSNTECTRTHNLLYSSFITFSFIFSVYLSFYLPSLHPLLPPVFSECCEQETSVLCPLIHVIENHWTVGWCHDWFLHTLECKGQWDTHVDMLVATYRHECEIYQLTLYHSRPNMFLFHSVR